MVIEIPIPAGIAKATKGNKFSDGFFLGDVNFRVGITALVGGRRCW